MSHYDTNLEKNKANFVPLTPLSFLQRAKDIYPNYEALVYEDRKYTWNDVYKRQDDASAACNDYLKVLGFVATAHAWIKVLEVSFKDYENNKNFYEDKIQTANFYFNRVLPRAESYFKSATSGSNYIMDFKFN